MNAKHSIRPLITGVDDARHRNGPHQNSGRASAGEVLVDLLTTKVRCLAVEQVASLVFSYAKAPRVAAGKHLRHMEEQGLLTIANVMAPKHFALEKPLLDWQPENGQPDFHHLSWFAEKRLATPPVRTRIVRATRKAQMRTLGAIGSRPLRSQEVTHDLMVSSVFAKHYKDLPAVARSWRSEDALLQELVSEQGDFSAATIPDAVLRVGDDEVMIEVVGRYSAKKLALIHEAHRERRYQLW